ncbi:unnamed protein product [Dracunculus medinensis]|uniref:Uncharacterized protein n=1 Tax=Dracunculus medinensis TaxID=318479 RepID=A0A0N4U8R8_DRAME|nr:unnamed protein product [Dracunculus medinensis]
MDSEPYHYAVSFKRSGRKLPSTPILPTRSVSESPSKYRRQSALPAYMFHPQDDYDPCKDCQLTLDRRRCNERERIANFYDQISTRIMHDERLSIFAIGSLS